MTPPKDPGMDDAAADGVADRVAVALDGAELRRWAFELFSPGPNALDEAVERALGQAASVAEWVQTGVSAADRIAAEKAAFWAEANARMDEVNAAYAAERAAPTAAAPSAVGGGVAALLERLGAEIESMLMARKAEIEALRPAPSASSTRLRDAGDTGP